MTASLCPVAACLRLFLAIESAINRTGRSVLDEADDFMDGDKIFCSISGTFFRSHQDGRAVRSFNEET
jgi:hypothetical protein